MRSVADPGQGLRPLPSSRREIQEGGRLTRRIRCRTELGAIAIEIGIGILPTWLDDDGGSVCPLALTRGFKIVPNQKNANDNGTFGL